MSEDKRAPPPGAIPTSEYQIEEVIQNIHEASISLRSGLPSPLPEEVSVRGTDLTRILEYSERAVEMLEKQSKKDIEYLIVGTIAGLILGITGNLLVSVFIEICKLYVPPQTNLGIWMILLLAIIIGTAYVGWTLYSKIGKKRLPFSKLKESISNKKNLHMVLHIAMMTAIVVLVIGHVYATTVWSRAYCKLCYQIIQRTYLNQNASALIQPYNDAIEEFVNILTGGWSNFSDWDEFWDDIFVMYSWVDENISYRADTFFPVLPGTLDGNITFVKDVWQYPDETLNLTKGDCEDQAILLCSMIINYVDGRCSSECVLIEGSDGTHVGVQIAFGVNITVLDATMHYCTADALGNVTDKYVDSEVSCWIEHCSLGNNTYVRRVFSHKLDMRFSSTDEYLSWMYARVANKESTDC